MSDRWYLNVLAEDPDAELLRDYETKARRARKAGRSFCPSPLARPLPGSPGCPVREPEHEERPDLEERAERAEAQLAEARGALGFYADGSNYVFAAVDGSGDEWSSSVHEDEGETARAALAKLGGEPS